MQLLKGLFLHQVIHVHVYVYTICGCINAIILGVFTTCIITLYTCTCTIIQYVHNCYLSAIIIN